LSSECVSLYWRRSEKKYTTPHDIALSDVMNEYILPLDPSKRSTDTLDSNGLRSKSSAAEGVQALVDL